MKDRRNFFTALTAWFSALCAAAQTPKPSAAKKLARHAFTGPQAGMEAILVEVTSVPGSP